jgi:hypothetical protein
VEQEAWAGTTPAVGEHVDHELVVDRDADVLRVALDWPTPDDMDLEIYRREGGELVQVGSSGNFVGEKEQADVPDPEPGTYVLRVLNFASVSPTYDLTAGLHEAVTRRTEGTRESYTLTCEKRGTVLQTTQVFIDRGQSKVVDLGQCRRRG